jgi:hypothetical protein
MIILTIAFDTFSGKTAKLTAIVIKATSRTPEKIREMKNNPPSLTVVAKDVSKDLNTKNLLVRKATNTEITHAKIVAI